MNGANSILLTITSIIFFKFLPRQVTLLERPSLTSASPLQSHCRLAIQTFQYSGTKVPSAGGPPSEMEGCCPGLQSCVPRIKWPQIIVYSYNRWRLLLSFTTDTEIG